MTDILISTDGRDYRRIGVVDIQLPRYGSVRLAGNMIWYADFTPEKRTDPTPNAGRHDFAPKEK